AGHARRGAHRLAHEIGRRAGNGPGEQGQPRHAANRGRQPARREDVAPPGAHGRRRPSMLRAGTYLRLYWIHAAWALSIPLYLWSGTRPDRYMQDVMGVEPSYPKSTIA